MGIKYFSKVWAVIFGQEKSWKKIARVPGYNITSVWRDLDQSSMGNVIITCWNTCSTKTQQWKAALNEKVCSQRREKSTIVHWKFYRCKPCQKLQISKKMIFQISSGNCELWVWIAFKCLIKVGLFSAVTIFVIWMNIIFFLDNFWSIFK